MKLSTTKQAAFSLIEVTLAIGVAGFSLLVILGLLTVSLKTHQSSTDQTVANSIISQVAADLRASRAIQPSSCGKCGPSRRAIGPDPAPPRRGIRGSFPEPTDAPHCPHARTGNLGKGEGESRVSGPGFAIAAYEAARKKPGCGREIAAQFNRLRIVAHVNESHRAGRGDAAIAAAGGAVGNRAAVGQRSARAAGAAAACAPTSVRVGRVGDFAGGTTEQRQKQARLPTTLPT